MRLLLSALLLSLATTIVFALVVRDAWQKTEAAQFENQFDTAVTQLSEQLAQAPKELSQRLAPLCQHDPIIDSALVGLQSGTVASRLLSIRSRLPGLRDALSLDELALITPKGVILGGSFGEGAFSGNTLAEMALKHDRSAHFQITPRRAFVASCIKKEGRDWVALIGASYLDGLLDDASSPDLRLTFLESSALAAKMPSSPNEPQEALLRRVQLDPLAGAIIQATRSRRPLLDSLHKLDLRVLGASGGALIGAFLLAFFLSSGLSRPIVEFANKTREAVQGNVEALPLSGGPELEQAARAFNATLEDLKALQKRLKATERIAARREVARQIAHEIKNPLSPIRSSIETLRKLKERNHSEFDSYFEESTLTVLSEVQRISNLVNSFSEYARLPSPQPRNLDLVPLTKRLVTLHREMGVTINLHCEALPQILADEEQLAQVLTNLLKNAIEATIHLDSPRIEVRLGLMKGAGEDHSPSTTVELTVSDNGPGVSQDILPRIFEPYGTTKREGTGLGLPISQRIAIEHGGDLTYATSPMGGAQFILHLPTSGPPKLPAEDALER